MHEDELMIAGVMVGGLALTVIGIALLGVVRVLCARRGVAGDEPEPLLMALIGWVLIVSGLVAVFTCATGPLVALLVLLVLGMAVLRQRRAQQYTLLSTLAVAAERLMPLVPAVEAFADERGGLLGWRARRLAELLRSGATLPDALQQTPGLVPQQALVTIRAGQESGALAEALRDAVGSHGLLAPLWNQLLARVLYVCFLMLFAVSVATFMMLRIVPEFQKIFAEFDAELPPLTRTITATSYLFANYWYVLAAPLLVILGLAFLGLGMQYMGGFRWNVPFVNWLTRRLDTAVILDALALAAERNVNFPAKIATLARWYPRQSVRKRLQAALRDVDAGADWCQSLARRGLIRRAELAVLGAAQRVGNLPWALREMADSSRRRLAYRLHALLQVLFPLTIAAFGLLVMAYVVGYFMPLVSLISSLA